MSRLDDIKNRNNSILEEKPKELALEVTDKFEVLKYMANKIATKVNGHEVILKGGAALMDRILTFNPGLSRVTTDLDLYVATEEVYCYIFNNILDILNDNELGLKFSISEHRGRRGIGEGFKFSVENKIGITQTFGIDMQVGQLGVINITPGVNINLDEYDNYTMLADKVTVVCSRKIFRRIKDIYDIYVLSMLQDYKMEVLVQTIKDKRPEFLESKRIMFRPDTMAELEHAYDKFTGIVNKPKFETVYKVSSNFVSPIYYGIDDGNVCKIWRKGGSAWL